MLDRLHAGRSGEFRKVLRACAIAASRGRHAVVLKVPAEQDPDAFLRAFHRHCRERSGRPARLLTLAPDGCGPAWTEACQATLGLPAGPVMPPDATLTDLLGAGDRLFERLRSTLAAELATGDCDFGPGLLIVQGDVTRERTLLAFLGHLCPHDALWHSLPGARARTEQFVVVAAVPSGADGEGPAAIPAELETLAIRPFHADDVRAAPDAAIELLTATLSARARPVPAPQATAALRPSRKTGARADAAIGAALRDGRFHDLPADAADVRTRMRALTARGRADDAIALALDPATHRGLDAAFLLEVADLALARANAAAATTLAAAAAKAGKADPVVQVRSVAVRAEIAFLKSDLPEAERLAREALSQDAPDAVRTAASNTLGKAAFRAGRHDEAETWYTRALEGCADSDAEAARACHNLGLVALRKGRYPSAIRHLQDAVVRADGAGETFGAALARRNLSVALEFQGKYQSAFEYGIEAVERLSRLGRPASLINALLTVADLLVTFGDWDRALALIAKAEELARAVDVPAALAHCDLKRGECLLLRGQAADAAVRLARARSEFAVLGLDDDRAFAASRLAEASLAAGRLADARTWIADAGGQAHDGKGGEAAARATLVLGRLELLGGAPAQALPILSRARDLLLAGGPRDVLAQASWALADASEALGDDAAAAALREEARAQVEEAAACVPAEHRKTFLARPDLVALAAGTAGTAADLPGAALESARVTSIGPRPRLRHHLPRIIGESEPLRRVLVMLERVRDVSVPVLLLGESGTGKELFAEALHVLSPRAGGPFIRVNAAAFSETLLLSELFGHEKGAFTGAHQRRIGRFEQAHGGTLFLDEIGDVGERLQTALLRVLEEQRFQRVGGTETVHVDVRVVFATNRDLAEAIRTGRFREDLYHRISGISIPVPPLRDRGDDIPMLAATFVTEIGRETSKKFQFAPDALELLRSWRWPGNVRELKNVVRKACLMADDPLVTRDVLLREVPELRRSVRRPAGSNAGGGGLDVFELVFGRGLSLFDARAEVEIALIRAALAQSQGNISAAAQMLGMKRPRLSQMVKEYGLKVLPEGATGEGPS